MDVRRRPARAADAVGCRDGPRCRVVALIARELGAGDAGWSSSEQAELYLYPGDQHYLRRLQPAVVRPRRRSAADPARDTRGEDGTVIHTALCGRQNGGRRRDLGTCRHRLDDASGDARLTSARRSDWARRRARPRCRSPHRWSDGGVRLRTVATPSASSRRARLRSQSSCGSPLVPC